MLKLLLCSVVVSVAADIKCYHGANLSFVDNAIVDELKSIQCSAKAKFCKRITGTINGKPGWAASCILSNSLTEAECKATAGTSDCKKVTLAGKGVLNSEYMECCCIGDNCNDVKLGGSNSSTTTTNTLTPEPKSNSVPSSTSNAGSNGSTGSTPASTIQSTTSSGSRTFSQLAVAFIFGAFLMTFGLKKQYITLLVVLASLSTGYALTCYSGSFRNENTEYSLEGLTTKDCAQEEVYCTSTYLNDGWGITITMGCADSSVCKEGVTDKQLDFDTSKRSCCVSDLCNGKSITMKTSFSFPDNFVFSTATAAYQIEGGAFEDGRGPSIWDTYVRKPGKIKDNSTGDVACDSYHKYKEDIQLMKNLGVTQYRFSISWSRIFPDGTPTSFNQKGADYYNSVINEVLAQKMTPVVTLFHWDLPQALMDIGGFLNPTIVDRFAEFAEYCYKTYGDRVKIWLTLNEPLTVALLDYCGDRDMTDAPGEWRDHCEWTMYWAGHNLILSHAKASEIYRTKYNADKKGQIGIVVNGNYFMPASTEQQDIDAAQRATLFAYGWFAHPIYHPDHDYPPLMQKRLSDLSLNETRKKSRLPSFTAEDKARLKDSANILGLNYYTSLLARDLPSWEYDYMRSHYVELSDAGIVAFNDPRWKQINSPIGWIYNVPQGFRELMNFMNQTYGNIPTLITENGCMDTGDEGLNDVSRINYLRSHLLAVISAINDGLNIIGYTFWSLLDNFEWRDGYSTKFGLHHVDFENPNRTRTAKLSADYYRTIATLKKVETL